VGFAEEWRECGGNYREDIEWARVGSSEYLSLNFVLQIARRRKKQRV
jgi:hypothetical protein